MGRKPDPDKPARDAEIYRLYLEGMSYQDIAYEVGMAVTPVSQIIRKGRKEGVIPADVVRRRGRTQHAKGECGRFGRKFDLLLYNANTSADEVAAMAGLTVGSLNRLTRGNFIPDLRYLGKLATGLGLTVSELTWLIDYTQTPEQEAQYHSIRSKVVDRVMRHKGSKVA